MAAFQSIDSGQKDVILSGLARLTALRNFSTNVGQWVSYN